MKQQHIWVTLGEWTKIRKIPGTWLLRNISRHIICTNGHFNLIHECLCLCIWIVHSKGVDEKEKRRTYTKERLRGRTEGKQRKLSICRSEQFNRSRKRSVVLFLFNRIVMLKNKISDTLHVLRASYEAAKKIQTQAHSHSTIIYSTSAHTLNQPIKRWKGARKERKTMSRQGKRMKSMFFFWTSLIKICQFFVRKYLNRRSTDYFNLCEPRVSREWDLLGEMKWNEKQHWREWWCWCWWWWQRRCQRLQPLRQFKRRKRWNTTKH